MFAKTLDGVVIALQQEADAEFSTFVPDHIVVGATEAPYGWKNPDVAPTPPASDARALTVADFDAALTAHLDATAQQRRYDNRITCALRAGYAGPFHAEGVAFALWMDASNALAYELLAQVQAGTLPLPSSTQALIDLLPVMVWP